MTDQQFQVGDRVKMIRYWDGYVARSVGTVVFVSENDYDYISQDYPDATDFNGYTVEFDEKEWEGMHGQHGREWTCPSVCIQKVKPNLDMLEEQKRTTLKSVRDYMKALGL